MVDFQPRSQGLSRYRGREEENEVGRLSAPDAHKPRKRDFFTNFGELNLLHEDLDLYISFTI